MGSRLLCHCICHGTANKCTRGNGRLRFISCIIMKLKQPALSLHLSPRLQYRTSLNLKRHTRALMRSGKMSSGFTCSTRETWTPSQSLFCASPRKRSPGSAASSRLPSTAETPQHFQRFLRRVRRRSGLEGRG